MHKAAAARNWQGYGHKNHLGLRTCDWTHGFKPGSLQRAREHSHAYTNETPETSHPRLDAESQAIADNAHEAPCAESHTVTAPNLGAAEPAKHRLRRQPATTHSCTLHHWSCNNRMTYCTLSFVVHHIFGTRHTPLSRCRRRGSSCQYLAMHPTLVLCKRFEGQQIRPYHLRDLCYILVLVNRSSVDVPVEMRIM